MTADAPSRMTGCGRIDRIAGSARVEGSTHVGSSWNRRRSRSPRPHEDIAARAVSQDRGCHRLSETAAASRPTWARAVVPHAARDRASRGRGAARARGISCAAIRDARRYRAGSRPNSAGRARSIRPPVPRTTRRGARHAGRSRRRCPDRHAPAESAISRRVRRQSRCARWSHQASAASLSTAATSRLRRSGRRHLQGLRHLRVELAPRSIEEGIAGPSGRGRRLPPSESRARS